MLLADYVLFGFCFCWECAFLGLFSGLNFGFGCYFVGFGFSGLLVCVVYVSGIGFCVF